MLQGVGSCTCIFGIVRRQEHEHDALEELRRVSGGRHPKRTAVHYAPRPWRQVADWYLVLPICRSKAVIADTVRCQAMR